jgi:hypothetical protein
MSAVAAINLVVYSSTFFFYYKGKDMRVWIQKKDFLNSLGLD